ncbi:MAG: site-specific integrase [Rhizobiales bacterium]|nr:site-specific integrase [Hyphomicrobiales bacterium]
MAHTIANLHYAARLINPDGDWRWLKEVSVRLAAGAHPINRFSRLVPPAHTLDFGIALMDTAFDLPLTAHWRRHLQYRDGLIITFLSLWPIRRRSITALTVADLSVDDAGVVVRLEVPDTKAKREESNRLPREIAPYVRRYLNVVRPILLHGQVDDGLWPSRKGGRVRGGSIYSIVRTRIRTRFGKDMGLHDMRRAAATYIAMDMPDKVGLIPGVLQHAGPEVGEQHYNFANAMKASVRYADTMAGLKAKLRAKKSVEGDS